VGAPVRLTGPVRKRLIASLKRMRRLGLNPKYDIRPNEAFIFLNINDIINFIVSRLPSDIRGFKTSAYREGDLLVVHIHRVGEEHVGQS